jgi:hypothetical protein
LQAPPEVEDAEGRCESAQRRGAHEQDRAEDEHPPAAQAVGQRRRGHDEHAHGQAVGGDHPLQRLFTAAELLLNVRQGDVHDRGVEVDHEQAEAGRQQGQPLAVREADSHTTTLGRPRGTLREQPPVGRWHHSAGHGDQRLTGSGE